MFHRRSRGTYGAPRIHKALVVEQIAIGRKRVARLMRAAGLVGVSRRKGTLTTRRDAEQPTASDLVARYFTAAGPDHPIVRVRGSA